MSKAASWILAIYVLAITGIAGYEYAYILWLERMLGAMLNGNPN